MAYYDLSLTASRVIDWHDEGIPTGIDVQKVYIGSDDMGSGFQVVSAVSTTAPTRDLLKRVFALRRGHRTVFLAVAIRCADRVWIFGPDDNSDIEQLEINHAQRFLQSILDESDSIAARNRFVALKQARSSTSISGVTNSGLFASHHLRENLPNRIDWQKNTEQAENVLVHRGKRLIDALGFRSVSDVGNSFLLMAASDAPRAIAILINDDDFFESNSSLYQISPVAFGLALAAKKNAPWLIVLRKDQIRLYPGTDGVGVGQKGQADTYLELDLAALDQDYAALLPLIFSADALSVDGSTDQILAESGKYAANLGVRLRDRIYENVVPPLAVAIAEQLHENKIELDPTGLQTAYQLTLRILFRLLFQAYAEDRGLLPSGRNELYDANSLKTIARRYLNTSPEEFSATAHSLWLGLTQVWDAIDKGNTLWQVPAYDGGLFSTESDRSDEEALMANLSLSDEVLGPVLHSLLIDTPEEGNHGPVDFRSLSVREFGSIYEGLLESSLSVAETDLAIDANGAWAPAKEGDTVEIKAGAVYFHSASGERKATGSYFTPKPIVDHLIERSVQPALATHLEKIANLMNDHEVKKAEGQFFDFRVADLAMGSGHFLVAAVDKIEAMMRNFISDHPLGSVKDELTRLADVAKKALGDDTVAQCEIDSINLLRRQIARRCIYGLDINPMAVELARLALWIHTFVPGLPMSNLDQNLVCADSLTGVGSIEEALEAYNPEMAATGKTKGQTNMFAEMVMREKLESAKSLLKDVSSASEANKAEIENSNQLFQKARQETEPIRKQFDAAIAARAGRIDPLSKVGEEDILQYMGSMEVEDFVKDLNPAHMPYLFPDVFIRDNPGFDVIVGNPPWETIKIEEHKWWGLRIPKLRSMPKKQQNIALEEFKLLRPDLTVVYQNDVKKRDEYRAIILGGPFRDLGSGGDVDLYQAFAWRSWQLIREGGVTSQVLPRMSLLSSNLLPWRKEILDNGSFADVCFLTNTNGWAFEAVHPQTSVALVSVSKQPDDNMYVSGPFHDEKSFLRDADTRTVIPVSEFLQWSNTLSFPLLPDNDAIELFRTYRRNPKFSQAFSDFEFRPLREFDSANDRQYFQFDLEEALGRIPIDKGESFNIWDPDYKKPYAYGRPTIIRKRLSERMIKGVVNTKSALYQLHYEDGLLPIDYPRIAFRKITNSTNSRTVICCLLPPGHTTQDGAPVLVRRSGGESSEAYLLGIMSSIPFDWEARLSVNQNLTFEVLNDLNIPRFLYKNAKCKRVAEISGRLAAVDERYSDWAEAVGVPVGSVTNQQEKEALIAELDALVSLLYGFSEAQVKHIFATFHRGWDYQSRLDAVLTYYKKWK